MADAVESKAAAEGFEVGVVGVGQSLGEVEVITAAEVHRSVFVDDAFVEGGEGNGELNSGAGLGAAGERELLVDHGENAAIGRIDGDDGAVHVAEGIHSGLANDGILTGGNVSGSQIGIGE